MTTNPHQRIQNQLDAITFDILILKAQSIITELRDALTPTKPNRKSR